MDHSSATAQQAGFSRPPRRHFFAFFAGSGAAAAATLPAGTKATSDHSSFSSFSMRPSTCGRAAAAPASQLSQRHQPRQRCQAKPSQRNHAGGPDKARRGPQGLPQAPLALKAPCPNATAHLFKRPHVHTRQLLWAQRVGGEACFESHCASERRGPGRAQAGTGPPLGPLSGASTPPSPAPPAPPAPRPLHLVAGRLLQPLLVLLHPLPRLVRLALRRLLLAV